jgi:hypothetical protein
MSQYNSQDEHSLGFYFADEEALSFELKKSTTLFLTKVNFQFLLKHNQCIFSLHPKHPSLCHPETQ